MISILSYMLAIIFAIVSLTTSDIAPLVLGLMFASIGVFTGKERQ